MLGLASRMGLGAGAGLGYPNVSLATEDIVLINESADVTIVGNSIEKTSGTSAFDAGAISSKSIQSGDGWVEFERTIGGKFACGLSNGDTDYGNADIDFAWQISLNGKLRVYENGVDMGLFGTTQLLDVFRVRIESGALIYSWNGVDEYTSLLAPTYPMLADISMGGVSSKISNLTISGVLG